MTLYKFNKLNSIQQLLLLELNGVRLDFRKEEGYHIALFQLGSFYVEAFYPNQSIKVEKLKAFASTHKLKPYLENINLELLLK
jgi:hypothetical protein